MYEHNRWESDSTEIEDKEQEIAEAETEAEITRIELEIESWEDYIDMWHKVVEEQEVAQDKLTLESLLGHNAREAILNKDIGIIEVWKDAYLDSIQDVIDKMEELQEAEDNLTQDSQVDLNQSYAVLPNGDKMNITVEDGKTLTTDLPKGTEVHPEGTDKVYVVTGGSGRPDDPYSSIQIGNGVGYAIVGGAGGEIQAVQFNGNSLVTPNLPIGTIVRPPNSSQLWEVTGGSGTKNDPYTSQKYDPKKDDYYDDDYMEEQYPEWNEDEEEEEEQPPEEDPNQDWYDQLMAQKPTTTGTYWIGTQAGRDLYNNLEIGEPYYNSGDKSTWTKYPDGSVVVYHSGEYKLAQFRSSGGSSSGGSSSGGSSSGGSSSGGGSSSKPDKEEEEEDKIYYNSANPQNLPVYKITSSAGKKQAYSMKPGDVFYGSDGSIWRMQSDGRIIVTHSGLMKAGIVMHKGLESGLIGDVDFDPNTEVFVKALKGEAILTEDQFKRGANLFNNLLSTNYAVETKRIPQNVDNSKTHSLTISNMNVYPNDANDFIKQMKNLVYTTSRQ